MYCNKCGSNLSEQDKFCNNCGNRVEQMPENIVQFNNTTSNNLNNDNVNTTNNNQVSNNDKFGLASLIIGIVAIIFVLLGKSFGFLLGIVGLILGIISKNKDKKKKTGIILNIVAMVIRIATIVIGAIFLVINPEFLNSLYNELDYSTSDNYVAGTWNCSKFDGTGTVGEYTVTMKLNKDNSFVFGEYGDLTNNHAGGTYTFEDETEKNETVTNGYKYFIINLNGNEEDYIIDGVLQNRIFAGKFEMGITSLNTKKEAILMNYYTYQMYYCYAQ